MAVSTAVRFVKSLAVSLAQTPNKCTNVRAPRGSQTHHRSTVTTDLSLNQSGGMPCAVRDYGG